MNNALLNNVIDRQRKVITPVLPPNKFGILTGRGARRQCAALLLSCTCYAEENMKTPMRGGTLDPAVAIECARQGDPDELLRITQMVATHPQLLPARKPLAQYHQYLQESNVFVQYFAVQVLAELKDKSSAEPLRQFITDTERRRKDLAFLGEKNLDVLGQKEAVALTFASQTALKALGEIDESSPMSVKVLASQLKHDIPMEWGGGVAHSALVKKGRAGLRALLDEAAQPLDDNQKAFLKPAIESINNRDLAVDLYVCCKDPKYHEVARKSALWALGVMAKQYADIEQMVINIVEDETSDLRSMAIERLGYIGSSRSRNTLLELEKALPPETKAVQAALLACDATNRLPEMIETFLSPKTPLDERRRVWGLLEGRSSELLPYTTQLLGVNDDGGVPINDLRVRVWIRLFELTKKLSPVELDYSDDERFMVVAGRIIIYLTSELDRRYAGTGKYTYAQLRQMALEETRRIVTKWDRQGKETKQ
jgi:HEAT repeat protein